MTRDEKIKRISELEKIKDDYKRAIDIMQGKENGDYPNVKHVGLIPKILWMLNLRKFQDVQYDYSHNKADEELQGIIEIYMTRKIAECDTEIDGFFCDDGDGIKFGGKSIDEIEDILDKQ